jgi:hypothetical protein
MGSPESYYEVETGASSLKSEEAVRITNRLFALGRVLCASQTVPERLTHC